MLVTADRSPDFRVRRRAARVWSGVLLLLCACETTPLYQTPTSTLTTSSPTVNPPSADPLPDGESCTADEDCDSQHCDQNVCCRGGACCKTASDCTADGQLAVAVCEDPATCQGVRGSVLCIGFRCRARDGVDDDSACDGKTMADGCGPYAAVFCTGEADQESPPCPTSCVDDSACDEGGHCERGECVDDRPDGDACDVDAECASGYCSNGRCCAGGDCCEQDSECPEATYGNMGMCTEPATCQGRRGVPACVEFRCATREVDDDSACDRNVIANDCGMGPDVKCRGGSEQEAPPPCATGTCGGFGFATCNAEAFCWQGACVPDQPNGEGCVDDGSCQSGHCANNVCCDEGDCCENDSQCAAMRTCDDRVTCQGHRQERYCDRSTGVCAMGNLVDDDSGCALMPSTRDCDLNAPPLCTAAENQADAPACPRCTTVPFCAMWVEGPPDPDTNAPTYNCARWDTAAVNCRLGAQCNVATGQCY